MAKWKHTLNIADMWHKARMRDIDADRCGQLIADAMERLPPSVKTKLFHMTVSMFRDELDDCDELDDALSVMFDWADMSRVWVKRA